MIRFGSKHVFEDVVRDFRIAVGHNCMGWFCERYGIGRLEWEANSSIHLIVLVAQWIEELRGEA